MVFDILFSPIKSAINLTKVLTSPKTTVGLATTLASLTGGPVAGAKTFAVTGGLLGIVKTSPTAVKFLGKKFKNPLGAGEFVGGKIEEIAKGGSPLPSNESLKEKVIEGAKTAGLVGAGAALIAGVATIGKVIKGKTKDVKIPDLSGVIPGPSNVAVNPISQPIKSPQQQPLGAAQKQPDKEIATMPMINNRITVKPNICVKISRSRKFINQQILVKQ